MAAEAATLLEKYAGAGNDDPSAALQLHQSIVRFEPDWEKYEATRSHARVLKTVKLNGEASATKAAFESNLNVLQSCMDLLSIQDEKPIQWVLTLFYDIIREDSSCMSIFEEALKHQIGVYKPLMMLLSRHKVDTYVADKSAWLLSAIIGHVPGSFTQDDVAALLRQLLAKEQHCTELGVLEAVTNLLKSDTFRVCVWSCPGVADCILKVQAKSSSAPFQYRSVFALWMLSFDDQIMTDLQSRGVIKTIKDILIFTRTEKVIRLCLTVLKNFMSNKALSEDVVEEGILEAVQSLEFEKWRDAELYDEIRDMATHISTEVNAMSNFERYERELHTGTLSWGFIHSTKFWAANVLKFEQNDFKALKMLAGLLLQPGTEPTTLAVACHDMGEFVTMHPLGKKKVAQLVIKERIMQLMGSTDPAYREVRREALLCCQKIMLNKWQDIEASQ